ncbi:MAG: glycine cleavage system protein GcvH [Thermoplasmata archaeon]|uniref:Probable glycine cleavage system H protein n=1 Tax=Candidatus Sysuiplasma superficiale TaxID=2823368 RepID=A0A8J8CCH7_9ARCH|nr:glycine cleavage system protein GcvH [Candidatus Sysuiplasma superficiale]MBX8643644.1 glycine cleavage system protein GcvH [Candidatus Sysuiplasma superficiale]
MSNIPDDLLYTKTHEWLKKEGKLYRIGITDHAQSELTDVVFVEFEKKGKMVGAGDVVATVESVKTVSEIYAPVPGTISEINEILLKSPEKINSDPYGEGWFLLLEPSGGMETASLLSPEAYRRTIGE